jgi:hypothetical protein
MGLRPGETRKMADPHSHYQPENSVDIHIPVYYT